MFTTIVISLLSFWIVVQMSTIKRMAKARESWKSSSASWKQTSEFHLKKWTEAAGERNRLIESLDESRRDHQQEHKRLEAAEADRDQWRLAADEHAKNHHDHIEQLTTEKERLAKRAFEAESLLDAERTLRESDQRSLADLRKRVIDERNLAWFHRDRAQHLECALTNANGEIRMALDRAIEKATGLPKTESPTAPPGYEFTGEVRPAKTGEYWLCKSLAYRATFDWYPDAEHVRILRPIASTETDTPGVPPAMPQTVPDEPAVPAGWELTGEKRPAKQGEYWLHEDGTVFQAMNDCGWHQFVDIVRRKVAGETCRKTEEGWAWSDGVQVAKSEVGNFWEVSTPDGWMEYSTPEAAAAAIGRTIPPEPMEVTK